MRLQAVASRMQGVLRRNTSHGQRAAP